MKSLILAFFCGLVMIGCKKSSVRPYETHGTLLGYDVRLCPFPECGGLLITIKNDTAKNPPQFYHIDATLEQLGINGSTKFPANVSFNYKPDTGRFVPYHYIIVTQIKVVP